MNEYMNAGVLSAKEEIKCEKVKKPVIGSKDVLIRVKVSGVCGSDISRIMKGKVHSFPIILGHEFSGEVVSVGDEVMKFKEGDRVIGVPLKPCFKCESCQRGNYSLCENYSFVGSREQGSFAEFISLPEKNVLKIPENVSFEDASFVEPSSVALHALRLMDFKEGSSVAIIGFGNIGYFLLQWARILGANSIVVIDRNQEKLDVAKRNGADYISMGLDKKQILEQKSKGYDYVIETTGDENSFSFCLEIAAKKAKVCVISSFKEEIKISSEKFELINRKELAFYGSWMSYSAPFPGIEWTKSIDVMSKKKMIIDKEIIGYKVSLKEIEKVVEILNNKTRRKGKILIINEEDGKIN